MLTKKATGVTFAIVKQSSFQSHDSIFLVWSLTSAPTLNEPLPKIMFELKGYMLEKCSSFQDYFKFLYRLITFRAKTHMNRNHW